MQKMKEYINFINSHFFYGKYKSTYNYINLQPSIKEYIIKFISIFILLCMFLFLIFTSFFSSAIISFILTIFFMNEIILNIKRIQYENFILSQLTIYTSQMSLLVTFNNIYTSLNEVVNFLEYPIKNDLQKVISSIDEGIPITKSFEEFNSKYNNRTVTLFNQSLELFDKHGNSDASNVLHIISEEMNLLKVKKDRYLKFKKEWRLNFYVITLMCMIMPIMLKFMIPDIYINYMNSFGTIIMSLIIFFNLYIIHKVEKIYRNQNIGEGGFK